LTASSNRSLDAPSDFVQLPTSSGSFMPPPVRDSRFGYRVRPAPSPNGSTDGLSDSIG
jgi:hypothetical protein